VNNLESFIFSNVCCLKKGFSGKSANAAYYSDAENVEVRVNIGRQALGESLNLAVPDKADVEKLRVSNVKN